MKESGIEEILFLECIFISMKDALFFSSQSKYVFIHEALLESIMCGDNSIKAPELKKKVEELKQVVPETGVSTSRDSVRCKLHEHYNGSQ